MSLPSASYLMIHTHKGIENIQLPKGTNLVINIYGLHRKKEIWGDDAHLFKPERFDFESSYDRSPFTFLPFSSGIRMCVGEYVVGFNGVCMLKGETLSFLGDTN